MSKFLIQERPLTVLPTLVKALGFEKAVVLQQIFWLQNQPNSGRVLEDGHKWVWGTYEEWCAQFFTFWDDPRTLRRHVNDLEKLGLLLSCKPNSAQWDHTKHYRVDVLALDSRLDAPDSVTPKGAAVPSSKGAGVPSSKGAGVPSSDYTDVPSSIGTEMSSETSTEMSSQTSKKKAKTTAPTPAEKRTQNLNLIKSKLGIRYSNTPKDEEVDLLTECFAEDPSRDMWLDLPPDRIRALIHQAQQKKKTTRFGTFKGFLIELLDLEAQTDTVTPTATPPVAAPPPKGGLSDESREALREAMGDELYDEMYGSG